MVLTPCFVLAVWSRSESEIAEVIPKGVGSHPNVAAGVAGQLVSTWSLFALVDTHHDKLYDGRRSNLAVRTCMPPCLIHTHSFII